MATDATILPLLYKYYQRAKLTPAEEDLLQAWLAHSTSNQQLFDELSNSAAWEKEMEKYGKLNTDPALVLLRQRLQKQEQPVLRMRSWLRVAALVGGLLVVVGAWYWWSNRTAVETPPIAEAAIHSPITSGHPDSLVTVESGNGTRVALVSGKPTQLTENGQVVASQQADQLNYTSTATNATDQFNTIRIPIGKQYKVVLSDGTRVWLNAVSQLRYPVLFSGDRREVELIGEGYFEVKADAKHPFIVRTERGAVTVTGTRFVVSAYPSDTEMITGLEEGKISLQAKEESRVMQPGQVLVIGESRGIQETKAKLHQVLAWKEQKIWFRETSFETIFQTLVRWYAITVQFEDKVDTRFTGVLPTNRPLEELLSILEKGGGVHFRLEGRVLTITK